MRKTAEIWQPRKKQLEILRVWQPSGLGGIRMVTAEVMAAKLLLTYFLSQDEVKIKGPVIFLLYQQYLEEFPNKALSEESIPEGKVLGEKEFLAFMKLTGTLPKYSKYGSAFSFVARRLVETTEVPIPGFLQDAVARVGAATDNRDPALRLLNTSELVRRGATVMKQEFANVVRPYFGTWLTYRLSTSGRRGEIVNVGLLDIRLKQIPHHAEADIPQFRFDQYGDLNDDRGSQVRGMFIATGDVLSAVGSRRGGTDIGRIGMITWDNIESEDITEKLKRPLEAKCCVPNADGTRTVNSFMVMKLIEGSNTWSDAKFDEQRFQLSSITDDGRILGRQPIDVIPSDIRVKFSSCVAAMTKSLEPFDAK